MLEDDGSPDSSSSPSPLHASFQKLQGSLNRRIQTYLDALVPFVWPRWIAAAVLFLLYSFRVWYWAGWYVVSYGLGIYLLNILVDFLSPLQDPDASDEAELPTSNNDEYRPFIRKLPEFTTWYRATRALSIALFLAMWQVFNIPVFWPILLIYFIMLFMGTMRQRLQHMIRHKYLPFSFGKPKFSKSTTI